MKTVLIVDESLGFILWLGKVLDSAAYRAVPSLGIPAAAAAITALGISIDLLIIDPGLAGAGEFIQTLRTEQENPGVIALVEDHSAGAPRSFPAVDGVGRRPIPLIPADDPAVETMPSTFTDASLAQSQEEWLTLVKAVLAKRTAAAGPNR